MRLLLLLLPPSLPLLLLQADPPQDPNRLKQVLKDTYGKFNEGIERWGQLWTYVQFSLSCRSCGDFAIFGSTCYRIVACTVATSIAVPLCCCGGGTCFVYRGIIQSVQGGLGPMGNPHEPLARWLVPRFGILSHNYCTVLYYCSIYTVQSGWTIPDHMLRSAVKRVIKDDLLGTYQNFLRRWVGIIPMGGGGGVGGGGVGVEWQVAYTKYGDHEENKI